ncbi:MAG: helix-turn-helix transcriptional regulator [Candidatus Izemoplasmatales bacterium]
MYDLKIKEIRIQKNITQKQIAEALGMTYQQFQKIENEIQVPGIDKLVKIALFLNVRLDDIVKYPVFKNK